MKSAISENNKKLVLIGSNRTFNEIIHELETLPEYTDGYNISQNMVKDIIVYLKDGDKIREIEKKNAELIAQIERIDEQIETNTMIENNLYLEKNICEIKYQRNCITIKELNEELNNQNQVLKQHVLTEEYHRLCQEEDKHYNNQEVQGMIDYFIAQDTLDHLRESKINAESKLDLLNTMNKYLKLQQDIDRVAQDISLCEKKDNLITKFAELQQQLQHHELLLSKESTFERYQKLVDITERLKMIDNNKELEKAINEIKEDIAEINDDILNQQTKIDSQSHKCNKINEELSLLQYRFKEQESIKQKLHSTELELIEMEKNIIPYTEYNSIMGNKGVTSKLLFTKIKSIESYINTVIQTFTKYRVHILYDEKKQNISMITENKLDSQYLSITRLSGYEKLMLQIAFKRALNKYSYNSKSSLIIIDEALDCIDQDNFLTKLPDVMNLITQDYSNCLAISQRDIMHISDHIVKIQKSNGCSTLVQG